MKILIVDDEADVQPLFLQHFRKELRHHDFEFDFALSGEEALEYLKTKSSEVVLILSDIIISKVNNFYYEKHISPQMQEISPSSLSYPTIPYPCHHLDTKT